MAQPGLCLNPGKLLIVGHNLETTNPESIKASSSMESLTSISKDKFQLTYFRPGFSKIPEKKSSIPWLGTNTASDNSDRYSDSDSESDNTKNVARWLESLPTNQDWCYVEDNLSTRQGDFEKSSSNIDSLSKNVTKNKFVTSYPSTSYKNDLPSTSLTQSKISKNKFSKINEPKSKQSSEKIRSGKLKVHFKETPTEIRLENSKYSKLSIGQESSSENLEKSKKPDSMSISKNYLTSDENNKERVGTRICSYNLRSLKSRKSEAKINDSDEKIGRSRRSCSIRCQEFRRKSREISSGNHQEKKNEYYPEENTKPPRKLKSPFTKQASSSKTPGLFIGTPDISSYQLDESEETEENMQKLDRKLAKRKQLERKVNVRSKLSRNKKLLKTVKDLVNVIENNPDPVQKPYYLRKSLKSGNEKFENTNLTESKIEKQVLSKNKPTFVNLKLEKKLDKAMGMAMNRYKRSYGNREIMLKKRNSEQLGEPPRKKKRPVF